MIGPGIVSTTQNWQVPREITSGCQLWLRADQGITQSGGTVSQWNDLSGAGNSVTQATSANQPTYVASAINGLPALTFGSLALMSRAAADPLASNFTIAFVIKVTNASIAYQVVYGNNGGVTYVEGLSHPTFGIYVGAEVSSGFRVDDGNYHICICSVTSVTATNGITFMVDGATSTGTGTSAYSANSGQIGSKTQSMDGNLCELLEYNTALSTAQMTTLTNYLGQKYGIS